MTDVDAAVERANVAIARAEAAEAERDELARSLDTAQEIALRQRDLLVARAETAEAKLARIADLHVEHPDDVVLAVGAYCLGCENDWPCETVRILDNEGADNA